jgi:hypothetical protein
MTPEVPSAPVAPRPRSGRLLTGALLLLALSGWATALVAFSRKQPQPVPEGPADGRAGVAVVFRISAHAPRVLSVGPAGPVDFDSYRLNQVALVKGRLMLNRVLKQPEVQSTNVVRTQPDPVWWLEHALKVDSRPQSEYMKVSLEGDNLDELLVVLTALSKAYLADAVERDNEARNFRRTILEEKSRAYRTELESYHKRLNTIALVLGAKDAQVLKLMDALAKDELKTAHREWTRVRDQIAVLAADPATADGPEVKKLAVYEEVMKRKVSEVQERIAKFNTYRLELENIKAQIAQAEKIAGRLSDEIEAVKIELGAPPRVTLAEEPYMYLPRTIRGADRGE